MKHFLSLLLFTFFVSQSFCQFTISGSASKAGNNSKLYLHKISMNDLQFPPETIAISEGKEFVYQMKAAMPDDLYKLSLSEDAAIQDFPENTFFFSPTTNGELKLSMSSFNELYNATVVTGSNANKQISSTLLQPLSGCFKLLKKAASIQTEQEKNNLFKELTSFQTQYIQSLQLNIVSSDEPGFLLAALYFLAKTQQSSGEGDFTSYYNTVELKVFPSSLKDEMKSLTEKIDIDIKAILQLTLKSADGKEEKTLSQFLTTDYTIIDLWASWCGACRKVNTSDLPAFAKKYHQSKQYSLISVSVDSDSAKWSKALVQDNITWRSYMVQRAEHSPIPAFLNGYGLPYYLLISKKGDLLFSSPNFMAVEERMKLYH